MNKLVLQGLPFREAYKKIGADIAAGNFEYSLTLAHTHEGSMGNLQNAAIASLMKETITQFNFGKVNAAINDLLR